MTEPVRFVDVLTMAAAVANYLGDPMVAPPHLVEAIDILSGAKTMEDLGRPVAPLVPRSAGGAVEPAVRELVRRWFADLGGDPRAELDAAQVSAFIGELRGLQGDG